MPWCGWFFLFLKKRFTSLRNAAGLKISFHLAAYFLIKQIKPVIDNHFHHTPDPEEEIISKPDNGQDQEVIQNQPDRGGFGGTSEFIRARPRLTKR